MAHFSWRAPLLSLIMAAFLACAAQAAPEPEPGAAPEKPGTEKDMTQEPASIADGRPQAAPVEPAASEPAADDQAPQAAQDTDEGPEQPVYPGVRNLHILRGGDGEPSISIYYPSFGKEEADSALKKFAESEADDFARDARELADAAGERPSSYGRWELATTFSLEKPNPDVASITFSTYAYTGGSHGNLVIECLNYDLNTGKRLALADLFRDPARAIAIMSEISAPRLREELGEDAEEDMIASGTAPEEANFTALSLNPKGLFVEFQPYQVGPWSIGPQRVEISLSQLAPAGPNQLIWPNAATATSEEPK